MKDVFLHPFCKILIERQEALLGMDEIVPHAHLSHPRKDGFLDDCPKFLRVVTGYGRINFPCLIRPHLNACLPLLFYVMLLSRLGTAGAMTDAVAAVSGPSG
jgi:hypothetical protein